MKLVYVPEEKQDKLIAAGQVTVDGVRAETGMKVEPWQVVRIGKKQVSRQEEMIVLAVNKPRGIVCTEERRGERQYCTFS